VDTVDIAKGVKFAHAVADGCAIDFCIVFGKLRSCQLANWQDCRIRVHEQTHDEVKHDANLQPLS